MSSTFDIVEHVIPGQHIRGYPRATKTRQEDTLRIAIKQYIPRDAPSPHDMPDNAVTVVGLHGNGFPKEIYQPYMEQLYTQLKSQGVTVRGIWMADNSHQGASGILNEGISGDMTDWFDRSRDLLQMINHFRDQMPRPLIGIAHSYACAQLIQLSIMHPRLLSTLVLCEPAILDGSVPGPNPGLISISRRDYWSTRSEAESSLRRGFRNWDPRVLDLYLEYGLRSLPTPIYDSSVDDNTTKNAVTLTTTRHQESWTYSQINFGSPDETLDRLLRPDQDPEIEWKRIAIRPETIITFRNLPFLRPSVLYVFGGKSYLSPVSEQEKKVQVTGVGAGGSGGARIGKVKKVVLENAGHVIPCEKGALESYVKESADWIASWFRQWLQDEKAIGDHENMSSDEGMLRMSKEWIEAVKMMVPSPRPFIVSPGNENKQDEKEKKSKDKRGGKVKL